MGKMISFATADGSADGHLAEAAPGSPAVVVLQEWWGLTPHIKEVADRFAAAGFTALAPDLYHGETVGHPDDAKRMMMALSMDRAAVELRGAVDLLLDLPTVSGDHVGAVGFCLGGGLALFLASIEPRVRATVDFYGVLPVPGARPDLTTVRGAVQGHFGADDAYIDADARAGLTATLEDAGVATELHVYAAGHAFFNDDRPEAYEPTAAETAWDRTEEFLRTRLAAS
ncbi:Carboxymethylenebutenolidase [Baekduia alba]|uniref:dienelactone hydrolase family protein n=1 Tax=Baekduia alba TaxID=2997333 RepID=UPI00234069AE|nr:dienelactone hydrolase family protein [Baekduia alba]WCB95306.1 Carboxymethylenebutenolidase [Baekduia alba]